MTRNYSADGTHDLDIVKGETILAQFGIPLILPSNGTIGDNGALSALTAMPTTYTSCFMYFPVDTIAVGVAAGWYYVVMSSTTAGTIYNNLYTTGTPAIPASLTAFSTTGPGAYTQTLTAITAVTIPIAGLMQCNSRVEVFVDQAQNGTAGAKTINVQFDTTVLHAHVGTTSLILPHKVVIQNRGIKTAQKVTRNSSTSEQAVASVSGQYFTVDTAATVSLILSLDLAVATDYVILEALIVSYWA